METEKLTSQTTLADDSQKPSLFTSARTHDRSHTTESLGGKDNDVKHENEKDHNERIGTAQENGMEFPDLDLPELNGRRAFTRWFPLWGLPAAYSRLIPLTLLLTALLLLVSLSTWLADRSRTESSYRQFTDRAQLAQINNDPDNARAAWTAAIDQAKKLGDGHKAIGDLYLKLAELDRQYAVIYYLSPRPQYFAAAQLIRQDIHNATAHYRLASNTTLDQIKAQNVLLSVSSMVLQPSMYPSNSDLFNAQKVLIEARVARHDGNLQKSMAKYTSYMNLTRRYQLYQKHNTTSVFDEIESLLEKVKLHNSTSDEALRLAHNLAYITEWPEMSVAHLVKNVKQLDALLAKVVAMNNTSGRLSPYNYEKHFADKMMANGDYRAATAAYLRCQGMRDSQAVRSNLIECHLKLRPPQAGSVAETILILDQLKKLHTAAFGANSRQVTKILKDYATVYLQAGEFEKSEKIRQEILKRELTDDTPDPDYTIGSPRAKRDSQQEAYADLMDCYIAEGKLKEARVLFDNAIKKLDEDDKEKSSQLNARFLELCGKAGWTNDRNTQNILRTAD